MNELPLSMIINFGIKKLEKSGLKIEIKKSSLINNFSLSKNECGAIAIPKPGRVGYELLKFSTPDIALPDTTLDSLWSCAKEHYGITALTAVTGVGGIPISKLTLGHGVWLGTGKKTNLISHYGLKFFPMAKLPPSTIAQMAKSTFGTIRIFGIVGRASPYVALGLAVYDVVSIGLCAYKEKNGR